MKKQNNMQQKTSAELNNINSKSKKWSKRLGIVALWAAGITMGFGLFTFIMVAAAAAPAAITMAGIITALAAAGFGAAVGGKAFADIKHAQSEDELKVRQIKSSVNPVTELDKFAADIAVRTNLSTVPELTTEQPVPQTTEPQKEEQPAPANQETAAEVTEEQTEVVAEEAPETAEPAAEAEEDAALKTFNDFIETTIVETEPEPLPEDTIVDEPAQEVVDQDTDDIVAHYNPEVYYVPTEAAVIENDEQLVAEDTQEAQDVEDVEDENVNTNE